MKQNEMKWNEMVDIKLRFSSENKIRVAQHSGKHNTRVPDYTKTQHCVLPVGIYWCVMKVLPSF